MSLPPPPSDTSLLAQLYSLWEQHSVPAIFYHYFLNAITLHPRSTQTKIIMQQITKCKNEKHLYNRIMQGIKGREKAVQGIKRDVQWLQKRQKANLQIAWNKYPSHPHVDTQDYSIVYQSSPQNQLYEGLYPNKTPSNKPVPSTRVLTELIAHINNYRHLTLHVVSLIYQWHSFLFSLGLAPPIQFIYHHQDYLLDLIAEGKELTQGLNGRLFEKNNPFLLIRADHEAQYDLLAERLKIDKERLLKISHAMTILVDYQAEIERRRIIGRFNQAGGNKGKFKINKSTSIHKIYNNYPIYNQYHKPFLMIQNSALRNDILRPSLPVKLQPLVKSSLIVNPSINAKIHAEHRHRVGVILEGKAKRSMSERKMPILVDGQSLRKSQSRYQNKLIERRLEIYNQLDQQIKYQKIKLGIDQDSHQEQKQIPIQVTPELQPPPLPPALPKITYIQPIPASQVLSTLRSLFPNPQITSFSALQAMTKQLLSYRSSITLITVHMGPVLCLFLAVIFRRKGLLSFRREVQIIVSKRVVDAAGIQDIMMEEWFKYRYCIIREKGKAIRQLGLQTENHSKAPKHSNKQIESSNRQIMPAIIFRYKFPKEISTADLQTQLKSLSKANSHLKHSRILKYYMYSSSTRYHRYCYDHQPNSCGIVFPSEELIRLKMDSRIWMKVKVDKIDKITELWRIHGIDFDILIGSWENIEKYQQDGGQGQTESTQYTFVLFPETRIARKHPLSTNSSAFLTESLTLYPGDTVPQILSIIQTRSQSHDLIIQKGSDQLWIAAAGRNGEDKGKILSAMQIE